MWLRQRAYLHTAVAWRVAPRATSLLSCQCAYDAPDTMYVTYALTGAVSWDSVPTTATASSSTPEKDTKRVKRIRLKQSTSAFPTLPTLYEGPLLCENMLARIYLYSYLVHLDHADALAWPTHHVDALHCWDDTLAFSILQRLLVPLAHLTSIEQGQPTSRTQEAVHAVRQFHAASHTPWAAARHLAEHYPVPFHALPHVASTLPSLASKPKARAVVEDVAPRRTRSAARLEARVAQLEERLREPVALSDDEDDEDEAPYTSRRRSQRAATLAVKKAHADLRARAAQLRAPQAPVLHDDAPPMPLEEKWACLVTLCDALAISTAKMPPFENPLHKLVQPIVDAAHSTHERKQRVQEVEQQCADELRALQKTAPSMVSPQYAAWKQQVRVSLLAHIRNKR